MKHWQTVLHGTLISQCEERVPEGQSVAPLCFCVVSALILPQFLGVQDIAGPSCVVALLSLYFSYYTYSEDQAGTICGSERGVICCPHLRGSTENLPSTCGAPELGVCLEIVPLEHWQCTSIWSIAAS